MACGQLKKPECIACEYLENYFIFVDNIVLQLYDRLRSPPCPAPFRLLSRLTDLHYTQFFSEYVMHVLKYKIIGIGCV